MESLLAGAAFGALSLVAYHHAAYPLLLRALSRRQKAPIRPAEPLELPHVTIVMPAYQEEGVIAEKIRNLASLDYPTSKLLVLIGCDGCSDRTVAIARNTAAEPECRDLHVEVFDFSENRGKVAVLNDLVSLCVPGIVLFTDVSALVSVDALRIAAAWFEDPSVGVVCATYRLWEPGSAGESLYWRQQVAVKKAEARIASTLGAHGAGYAVRRELLSPLPVDTINDDFILPASIVAAGYRAVYETEMIALELETASTAMDYKRRRRIAAGNLQQVSRLARLLSPRQGWNAWLFLSGKTLRVAVPILLLVALGASFALGLAGSTFFAVFTALQVIGYAVALAADRLPAGRYLAPLTYLVRGHLEGLIGMVRHLTGGSRTRWQRVTLSAETK